MFHLLKLVGRNTWLKSEQILGIDSVCLIQDLTPAVLASCFCPKESQVICREKKIVILCTAWEKEIRTFLVFCYRLFLKTKIRSSEDMSQMMLQGLTKTRFPAIQE